MFYNFCDVAHTYFPGSYGFPVFRSPLPPPLFRRCSPQDAIYLPCDRAFRRFEYFKGPQSTISIGSNAGRMLCNRVQRMSSSIRLDFFPRRSFFLLLVFSPKRRDPVIFFFSRRSKRHRCAYKMENKIATNTAANVRARNRNVLGDYAAGIEPEVVGWQPVGQDVGGIFFDNAQTIVFVRRNRGTVWVFILFSTGSVSH